jgi:hypothetical protein
MRIASVFVRTPNLFMFRVPMGELLGFQSLAYEIKLLADSHSLCTRSFLI